MSSATLVTSDFELHFGFSAVGIECRLRSCRGSGVRQPYEKLPGNLRKGRPVNEMPTEIDVKEIQQRYSDAWNSHDPDAIATLHTDC